MDGQICLMHMEEQVILRNADNGCALGSVMSGSSGTFTMCIWKESSSNGNNKILVRFKLTSGQSITNISILIIEV